MVQSHRIGSQGPNYDDGASLQSNRCPPVTSGAGPAFARLQTMPAELELALALASLRERQGEDDKARSNLY